MTNYRIVCTTQEPANHPTTNAHIVAVGVGEDPNKADQKFTLDEVLRLMDLGHTFYTQGTQSGRVARVEKYTCAYCRRVYIRSTPDSVTDNNLDSLRVCNWQS